MLFMGSSIGRAESLLFGVIGLGLLILAVPSWRSGLEIIAVIVLLLAGGSFFLAVKLGRWANWASGRYSMDGQTLLHEGQGGVVTGVDLNSAELKIVGLFGESYDRLTRGFAVMVVSDNRSRIIIWPQMSPNVASQVNSVLTSRNPEE
jgi:hypothetical protein